MSSAIKQMGAEIAESIVTATSNPICCFIHRSVCNCSFSKFFHYDFLDCCHGKQWQALGISGAIPMIMGANIGTTVTNTIVSVGHINKGTEFKRIRCINRARLF